MLGSFLSIRHNGGEFKKENSIKKTSQVGLACRQACGTSSCKSRGASLEAMLLPGLCVQIPVFSFLPCLSSTMDGVKYKPQKSFPPRAGLCQCLSQRKTKQNITTREHFKKNLHKQNYTS